MTKRKTKPATPLVVKRAPPVVDPRITGLLGETVTPKTVNDLYAALYNIVLPWTVNRDNTWTHERKTATGHTVGIVTTRLGEFTSGICPRHYGWGFSARNQSGYGSICSGIEKVDLVGATTEENIKHRELLALRAAQERVDNFLRKEFPFLRLLDEPSIVQQIGEVA